MISFILKIFIIHYLLIPIGSLISSQQENRYITFSTNLIYGLILISFFALLINFFSPLNLIVNSLIILTLFLSSIYKQWEMILNKELFIYSIVSTFIISILILESNVYRPDAGLYHLPFINILNEEKIIFGLSNLHFRYAHTSILQHTSAVMNNYLLGVNGIVIPSAILVSSILINFTFRILNKINIKEFNIELYFLLFIQIFIFFKINRYSEYGNDAPAHLLVFYLISILIKKSFLNTDEILKILILTLFIIQNKIILAFSVFFILIYLNKEFISKFWKKKNFYFLTLFFLIWIIKNLVISGCFIFPVTSLCSENFLWSNKNLSKSVSIENEAWAKGWPDYVNNTNLDKDKKVSIENYSKKFYWFKTWSSNHLKLIFKVIISYLLISLIIFAFFFKIQNEKKINEKNFEKYIYWIIFILIISNIIWIIKVPVFRYGYSYLISLIVLTFSFIGFKYLDLRHNFLKKYIGFICLGLLVITLKNGVRIIQTDNNYFNYPWPKFYSMDNVQNKYPDLEELYISEKKFYKPATNNYCMYFKSPCINYGNYLNAKLVKKSGYYFIFLN
ncbi:hypothetical protein OA407_03295 [Candidatus Pelagibacter sp.]|nr:hypothetical protein [Candidatus Pelagibacter sp.]